jgi:hypothetical protein
VPLRESVEVFIASDPESRKPAVPLALAGEALVELRRYPEAIESLERALSLMEGAGHEIWRVARAEFALARALLARDRDRAISLARSAEARFSEQPTLNPGRLAKVREWLTARAK